jgi:hypothetical protein
MIDIVITLVGLLLLYLELKRGQERLHDAINRRQNPELNEQIREREARLRELTRACKLEERKLSRLQVREVVSSYIQEYCREHEESIGKLFEKYALDFSETPLFKEFNRMNKRLDSMRVQVFKEIIKEEKVLLLRQLKERIPSISKYDMVLLVLARLQYPDNTICNVLKIEPPALKQRKTRLKEKIQSHVRGGEKETFNTIIPMLFEQLQELENE